MGHSYASSFDYPFFSQFHDSLKKLPLIQFILWAQEHSGARCIVTHFCCFTTSYRLSLTSVGDLHGIYTGKRSLEASLMRELCQGKQEKEGGGRIKAYV